MKKTILIMSAIGTMLVVNMASAQNKKSMAVLNIDTKGIIQDPVLTSSMVRTEVEKLDKYTVMDRYDLEYRVNQQELSLENCYGAICATKVGKVLQVDKIMTGSIERFGEKIIYTLRLIDVSTGEIEKSSVLEFENLQPHLQKMTGFVLAEMFGLEKDKILYQELAYIEEPVINPAARLNASGPRMGVAYITQGSGDYTIQDMLNERDAYPVLTQFGYQHEMQYLSSGNFQALFEVVILASGMDQGMFIPSLSFLNGFRNSKNGLEVAFGPVIGVVPNEYDEIEIKSKWAWALGKTFKSGHLNIPVNVYVTPNKKDGWFIGGSFGFNLANKKLNR